MTDQDLASLEEEPVFDRTFIGSFGHFESSDSFPVEYISTSLTASQASEFLEFARDIRMSQFDFELLMQRDIDDERVEDKLKPYLRPKTSSARRQKPVFFPPLLVAIVPVKKQELQPYYPDEVVSPADKVVIREWTNLFQLKYLRSDAPQSFQLKHGSEYIGVNRSQVSLKLRTATGDDYGSKLVVIDGQHRLLALKQVYAESSDALSNLTIPVCILFPPHVTEAESKANQGSGVPTVSEVFRNLFVDVNETMEVVGGHFTILLGDDSISHLACRALCSKVLQEYGQEGLAVVEWNIKKRKDSNNINRPYSLTSIGIIRKALDETFRQPRKKMEYLLKLGGKVSETLNPEGGDEYDYPRVKWDKFSVFQKPILQEQVGNTVVPGLCKIFFETTEFRRVFDEFCRQVDSLRARQEQEKDPNLAKVLNKVLLYNPISSSQEDAQVEYQNFMKQAEAWRYDCAGIVQYALFQRAVINAWGFFLTKCQDYALTPERAASGIVALLNEALKNRGEKMHYSHEYMQHTVFNTNKIKTKEDTRKALLMFVLSHLGNRDIAQNVADVLTGSESTPGELVDELAIRGYESAGEFLSIYESERKKAFKASYRVDATLDPDSREDLIEAEEDFKRDWAEVRAGRKLKENISTRFDELVASHVKDDVALAHDALKKALSFEADIVEMREEEGEYAVGESTEDDES
ncbi:hypothetical protein [Arhodomonas sp. AD133]|uniref:hypothetical protein n=1 Tax=Arhodomonas sp. AD133 TaxID=3415009 RepID=UPI003EBC0010